MPELVIELHLTPSQVLSYYRGQTRAVQARAMTGQVVQFPASALQRVVTNDGVHGLFRLEFDAQNKFVGLNPLPRR